MRFAPALGLTCRLALAVAVMPGCGASDAPPDHVVARSTELRGYESCRDLEADLKDLLTREVWADIDYADEAYAQGDASSSGGAAGGDSSTGGGRQEGVDYSGTNNQVQGVDEADLVKTDGYHLYTLNGHRLHIFGTPSFGDLVPESVTELEGHPTEMLLDAAANRAVVFSVVDVGSLPDGHPLKQLVGWQGDAWYWRIGALTKITVLDITDRTAPHLVREVYFEGWYDTARKVDSTVRMAAYSWLSLPFVYNWWQVYAAHGRDKEETKTEMARRIQALKLADLIPQMYVRTPDGRFVTSSLSTKSCQSFYRPTDSHARGIASVISFNLLGDDFFWDADHVVSSWPTFYESQDRFVIAESAHSSWWYYWFRDDPEQTNIHVFDTSQAGQAHYLGSGRVDGSVRDAFAIDERAGTIRIAATSGGWWHFGTQSSDPVENHVDVLAPHGARYDQVGHLGGITVGERLTATRFVGDQAYLSTFKYTDPLITVDLADPARPRVVGELQVPGMSTYLQAIGDHRLLSIGVDGGWGKTNISLFDVANPATPALDQTLPIAAPNGWTWSEALWQHKAFQYWAPAGLLAIPTSNYSYANNTYRYLSKLELISVDPATGTLALHGEIDHSPYYNDDPGYWSYTEIRRSVFMGNYVYAVSDKAITVHRTADLGKVNEQRLPGYVEGDGWWWW